MESLSDNVSLYITNDEDDESKNIVQAYCHEHTYSNLENILDTFRCLIENTQLLLTEQINFNFIEFCKNLQKLVGEYA